MIGKLHLSGTSTRKSHTVSDLETSVARTEVPCLHSPCILSTVEVDIHSGNVEHSDTIEVVLRPTGKFNLLNLHVS